MISREELAELKEKRRTNLYYEEKEYLQYVFLYAISRYADSFTFKGGTCLRICYGLERASEGLDFSTSLSLGKTRGLFNKCMAEFEKLGIAPLGTVEKSFKGNIRFESRFEGPLYAGDRKTSNLLKIDFNKQKSINVVPKAVPRLFSDIPVFTLNVLHEKEILAEKIRALASRGQPRDLYDIWVLLQTVEPDKRLVDRKLNEEGVKLSDMDFPTEKAYNTDLRDLLLHVPDYASVKGYVEGRLSQLKGT
jgi:predicted nucleotidyltransferase component of viral defense system